MADADIESSLRKAVRAHHGEADFTINKARAIAREELDLDDDFFANAPWKSRSKDIVHDQNDKCDRGEEVGQVKPTTKAKRKSLKRPSPVPSPQPRKKSKITQVSEDENLDESEGRGAVEHSSELSDALSSDSEFADEVKPTSKKRSQKPPKPTGSTIPTNPQPTKKPKPKSKPKKDSSSELSDAPSPAEDADDKPAPVTVVKDNDTSSELSSVVDDDPPPKKSKAKNGSSKVAAQPRKSSSSKPATEADPNAEEVKRLQGWLAKCGIRKVWGRELKPFGSSKAKISHLKSLLADVGMTGRYSNEKAAQIREARELAADIEAVQEGNERWGKDSDEEDDATEGGRPQRRLIRGAQNYDFLSSDGEETD